MTKLKIICLLIFVCGINSCQKVTSQVSGIREVKNKSRTNKQAPAECLDTFRAFFSYLQKSESNIITDEKAQIRWLSKLMRASLDGHIQRFGDPTAKPGFPSNSSFIGVWNNPTTYSIIGSRHYDYRNAQNPNDNRAVIDVLYEWEKNEDERNLNNQYPEERFLMSFIFVYEDGLWKLDDVYTFSDEYMTPGGLRNGFDER